MTDRRLLFLWLGWLALSALVAWSIVRDMSGSWLGNVLLLIGFATLFGYTERAFGRWRNVSRSATRVQ